MSLLKSLFGKKETRSGKQSKETGQDFTLSSSLEENKKNILKLFERCDDFSMRDFVIDRRRKAFAFYFGSLASSEQINRFILEQFMHIDPDNARLITSAEKILDRIIPVHSVKATDKAEDILSAVYSGDCVVLIDAVKEALIINIRESKGRQVGEPIVETSVLGPQDGFVEDIHLNVGLLRRRVKTAKLKIMNFEKGRVSKSTIAIVYVEGIAKENLVEEMKRRISRIDTDGFIDTGYLRRFINDSKFTPFPQEIMTERSDRCVNHLLEGRIAVMLDGSPFVIIYPCVFIDMLKSADEAYMNFYVALFIRVISITGLLVSTLGSATYIALTVFSPGMIPTQLLITIASSRAGIPFPAIIEAFIMEFTFELLREANIRIPKPIGPAISIVGGLVIGQSVVQAGIASQAMIIVVALNSIASFAVPGYTTNNSLRLVRFLFMFAASVFGMYGIISLFVAFLVHAASLRSLGIPYLSPLAPLNLKDVLNTLVQAPTSMQIYRPSFLEVENPVHTTKGSSQGKKSKEGVSQ